MFTHTSSFLGIFQLFIVLINYSSKIHHFVNDIIYTNANMNNIKHTGNWGGDKKFFYTCFNILPHGAQKYKMVLWYV